jgi:hypothetical protein
MIKDTDFLPNKGCCVAGMWTQHLRFVSSLQFFRVLWCSAVETLKVTDVGRKVLPDFFWL